jgi:hypothetical protein
MPIRWFSDLSQCLQISEMIAGWAFSFNLLQFS